MKQRKFRKSVFMVVYSKDKKEKNKIEYLILKRKLHWRGWEFPKGGFEKGEKVQDTIKRELFEETGLTPINIKKFNFSGKYKYNKELPDRPGVIGQEFQLYAVEVKKPIKGKIKIDKKEHSNYKWLNFKKALKKLTWPNQKKCLEIVNDWLNSSKLQKFREITTASRKKVLGGKNAEQNEELVKQFIGKENIILHTAAPGSPFCIILSLKPSKEDIKEAAIFCAAYSRDWKKNKKDVIVHQFKGKNVYKTKEMKQGTFNVKRFKDIKVKKEEIERFLKKRKI